MNHNNSKAKSSSTCSKSLKHRFTQLLISSSCTGAASASTATKLIKPSIAPLDYTDECRCKLNRSPPLAVVSRHRAPLIAASPVISISFDCGPRRRSFHSSEPLSPERVGRVTDNRSERDCQKWHRLTSSSPQSLNKSKCRRETETKSVKKSKAKRRETVETPSKAYVFGGSSSLFYSTSDEDDDDEEEEEEEEYTGSTLFSSKSFSSDSSEFYRSNRSEKKKKEIKSRSMTMKSTRRPPRINRNSIPNSKKNREKEPERGGGGAGGGFAVAKTSSDPYMDFRGSMVEMIVERRIKRAEDLELLLDSYLTLNSARHYPAILEAFTDIWEAVFCCHD